MLIRLSPRDRALIGQRVGDYLVGGLVGTGATSVVFECQHATTGERRAIKVLLAERAGKRKNVDRFFDEARAIRSVTHPGLVRIIEHGQLDDGRVFIVMELLIGQSLQERIGAALRRGRRLPIAMALRLCHQMADALSAIHAQGIVHRDIKPENVILVPAAEAEGGEQAKILDFGIAKFLEQSAGERRTTMGMVLGSPIYMSPEQCRGAEPATPVDIYSLGIIFYEMLAGHPPFSSDDPAVVMGQHLSAPPPPLPTVRPDVPAPVWALCSDMLQKDPAARPTMAVVAARAQALSQELASARRARPPKDAGAPPRRDAGPPAAGPIIALVLGALFAALFWAWFSL
jgi:serine/threonine-protein kinase